MMRSSPLSPELFVMSTHPVIVVTVIGAATAAAVATREATNRAARLARNTADLRTTVATFRWDLRDGSATRKKRAIREIRA